jgi:transcription-repair coupling factor (superfamily II helicase)
MPIDFTIFEKALHSLKKRETGEFTSLAGSSQSLFFSMIAESSLLLCRSEDSASELHEDAVFWSEALGNEKPLLIPPQGDSSRLKHIWKLYTQGATKVIASVEAAVSSLWERDAFPFIRISKSCTSDRELMIETLKRYGFKTVPIVSGQGELSIRGGILDIFPAEQELPLRIEFFGDEIESLRSFDILQNPGKDRILLMFSKNTQWL